MSSPEAKPKKVYKVVEDRAHSLTTGCVETEARVKDSATGSQTARVSVSVRVKDRTRGG